MALLLMLAILAADLSSVADQSTVRLVTTGRKSGEPRAVTIWFVVDGERVYVQAGKGGKTDWFQNLQKTPAITLEVADHRWNGVAHVVENPAETARVHELFRKKYWLARASGWVGLRFGAGRVVRIEVAENKP